VYGKQKEKTNTAVARVVCLNNRAMAALQRQRKFRQVGGGSVFQDPRYGEDWKGEEAFHNDLEMARLESSLLSQSVPEVGARPRKYPIFIMFCGPGGSHIGAA
jgi:hypothetical protein